jgi:hypothetical protein
LFPERKLLIGIILCSAVWLAELIKDPIRRRITKCEEILYERRFMKIKILFDETYTSNDRKRTSRNNWYGYADISVDGSRFSALF